MDCLSGNKFRDMVAQHLRGVEPWEITLFHDTVKISGKHKIGFYGILPEVTIPCIDKYTHAYDSCTF